MADEIVKQEAEGQAKAEIKTEISLQDILTRFEKLELAVYKPNDKPIQVQSKKNFNTDPGPFPRGSGVSNIK
jgi:hypothetical protein